MGLSQTGIARSKLLSPFLFLRLRFGERWRYNVAALIIGGLLAATYWMLPVKPPLLGQTGLLEDVKAFVTIVFPFYVAALVAVATFQRTELDDMPNGGQVTLHRRNEPIISLTRRQFVCFIFGYCSALSVLLFLMVMLSKMLQPWLVGLIPGLLPYAKVALLAGLGSVFAHMMIITFWGLYYLTDRVHR